MKSVKFVTLSALLIMAGINIASAQVSIEPIGIAVAIENEDTIAVDVTLTNNGDTDILYTIDFDEPEAEERGQGPRRDDIEGTFALFQDAETFGYVDTYVFQQIDDLDYEWFRNADDLVDVDLDDYTALWVETGNQSDAYKRNWDGNLERFEDYVSHGGVMFIEQGHNEGNNATHTTPGGLDYVWDPQEGNLSVGPDENWLVEQMGWEINRVDFQGGSFTHVTYPEDNLNEIEDCDWYQVIAEGRDNGEAAIIIYEYGRGNVIVSGSPCGHQWRNHNVQGRWGSCGETLLEWMSLLSKPGWIMSVPEEGVIDANSTAELEIIFSPLEMEAGVYEMYVLIELAESDNRDDLDENLIMISAIMSVGTPIANVTGTITDAANDNPVEDAKLDVSGHYFARFTDENGQYSADNMPLGDYEVTISATDFLTTVEEINIEEDGDLEWNLALLHSECTPSERQFFMQLEPGYTHEFEFQVDNGGNGPLTYAVDRRLLGDANAEPFELRQTDEIQDACGDDMLAGAVFAEEQFFISGGNNGGNPNKIYILNTDREVVGEFDQFVEDRYGMRDLAYDGELIWGAVEGTFYGFTTTGELEIEFSVDVNLEGRALAWDPVDQVLLASDISTDIFAINRDGDVVETYNRPAELRIYGLGVWPDDPDDCYLYVFCRGPDNVGINVFKLNPVNSEYMLVAYFDVGDGRPSGIQITNQLDVYSWVIVSLVQNPDRLNVWQLDARKEWFQVTPTAGVIEPDEHEGFALTLDATGLPVDNDFCGEVVFMHDGIGQETALDVTLSVQEGRVQTTRDIDLHIGWNTISTNLQPNDNENIEGLVDSIVTTGAMIMMKNTNGDFYRPAYDFNNIQAWNSWDGFQMLMAEAATLTIAGESVLKEDPIDLTEGWQLVSYYPRYEIEATVALTTIYDHLIIAKDGSGNFYLPEWDDFSNMGNMCEDQGYFIKVDADCRLVYVPEEEEERNASMIHSKSVYDKLGQLPVHAVTGENMSLLVTTDASLEGDVGVYAGGELVGSGVIQNGVCGIAIWGDDQSTETIDGAISGDALEVKLLTDSGLQNASYTVLSGKLTYETDGLAIIRLNSTSEIPLEFGIVSAYPNPFNSQMRVSYSLLETGLVDLAAYDVSGRRVAELTSGRQVSGAHTVMFDGKDMPSGVYMLRLQACGQSSMMKVMLVK